MKQYSKKNGYYKHYTATGKKFRVKIVPTVQEHNSSNNVLIKFKTDKHSEGWMYTYPTAKLDSVNSVINYLGKNTENTGNIYEVYFTDRATTK